MAITVTSATPSRVASGGRTMVDIRGTGFVVPTPPMDYPGPIPPQPPTMRVRFGATEAISVGVVSATRMIVVVPPTPPAAHDIHVEALDAFGAVVDSGVMVAGLTSARPDLTVEGDMLRIVRAMIRLLKQQVVPEVVWSTQVDYADNPLDMLPETAKSKVPAVWLTGPDERDSSPTERQVAPVETPTALGAIETRSPRTVDLVFGISAITDSGLVILNLVQALESFFVRNTRLQVARAAGSSETIGLELVLESGFNTNNQPNDDGLVTSTGSFSIRAIDLLTMPGFEDDLVTTIHPAVVEIDVGTTQL